MRCERCGKQSKVTFRREGGFHTKEDLERLAAEKNYTGRVSEEGRRFVPYHRMCVRCVEKGIKQGSFLKGDIIRNPTIEPSGDPFEWVVNTE